MNGTVVKKNFNFERRFVLPKIEHSWLVVAQIVQIQDFSFYKKRFH